MEHRIRIALQFLKDGQAFTVGDLRLNSEKGNTIEVMGSSQFTNFGNLTKLQCIQELEEIKVQFEHMKSISQELKDFMQGKVTKYSLVFDDYGKGSIDICSEINGTIGWNRVFPWATDI